MEFLKNLYRFYCECSHVKTKIYELQGQDARKDPTEFNSRLIFGELCILSSCPLWNKNTFANTFASVKCLKNI